MIGPWVVMVIVMDRGPSVIATEGVIREFWTDSSFVPSLGLAYLRLIKVRSWGPDRSI
jgi:hypothetical protein